MEHDRIGRRYDAGDQPVMWSLDRDPVGFHRSGWLRHASVSGVGLVVHAREPVEPGVGLRVQLIGDASFDGVVNRVVGSGDWLLVAVEYTQVSDACRAWCNDVVDRNESGLTTRALWVDPHVLPPSSGRT